ncbi:MAG: hypothetical protein Q8P27_01395 [Candidatus Peregrinibacteria bacterium]|nr:hypothetical protein [Candidatus Peregrinibacteria bacterium]
MASKKTTTKSASKIKPNTKAVPSKKSTPKKVMDIKKPKKLAGKTTTEVSKKASPKEIYFNGPHFLKRWHEKLMNSRFLRGGILAVILLGVGLGAVTLAYRLWQPPSLAELLPAAETLAYIEFDIEAYKLATEDAPPGFPFSINDLKCLFSGDFLSLECDTPTWMGNHAGLAWIQNLTTNEVHQWIFMEVDDRSVAEEYMGSLQTETTIAYMLRGYLIVGPNNETLEYLKDVEAGNRNSLKQDIDFIELRPHLSYHAAAFGYMNPRLAWSLANNEEESAWQGLWLEREWEFELLAEMVRWAPAFGMTLTDHEAGVMIQTYLVGDKQLVGGNALFHMDTKYKADLLQYFPDTVDRFVGGEDLGNGLDQLADVFNAIDGVSGLVLEGILMDKLIPYFGDDYSLSETFYPLFGNEYAVGWILEEDCSMVHMIPESEQEDIMECTSEYRPILAIELDEETTITTIESLNETLLSRGLIEIDVENSTLRQMSLEMTVETQRDMNFNVLKQEDGSDLIQFMVYEDILFVTTQKSEMKSVINALLDSEGLWSGTNSYAWFEEVLSSADHGVSWGTNGSYGTERIHSGINLFDDGISTLHILEFL